MRDTLFDTTDYRRFVLEALRRRGSHQRDLAAGIGRAPSAISLVLSGLRALDPALVEPIAQFLELDGEQAAYFAALVDVENKSARARRAAWATIQATQRHRAEAGLSPGVLEASRHWYFPVVMELAACEGFRPDPAWIAGTLQPPITVAQAEAVLRTAITLGVLVPDEDGGLTPSQTVNWTPPQVELHEGGPAIGEAHRIALEITAASIDADLANERHITRTVFRLTEEQLERVRARLEELEREIVLAVSEPVGPTNRVYQLGIQLIPASLFTDSTADHSMFAKSQGEPPDIEPATTE